MSNIYVDRFETSNYYCEKWYNHGILHRDNDLPAYTCKYSDGTTDEAWYYNGVLHRGYNKPAFITIDNKDNIVFEKYYYDGNKKVYRSYKNNKLFWEIYFKDDKKYKEVLCGKVFNYD